MSSPFLFLLHEEHCEQGVTFHPGVAWLLSSRTEWFRNSRKIIASLPIRNNNGPEKQD